MTEAEWLAATDPQPMLEFLKGKVGDRKLRLFQVACCRRIDYLLRFKACRVGVDVAERYADGRVSEEEKFEAFRAVANVKEFGTPLTLASLWRDRTVCFACLAVYEALQSNERVRFDGGATVPRRVSEAVFWRASRAAGRGDATAYGSAKSAAEGESATLSALVRDILGNPFRPVAFSPEWRTSTAVAIAQQMYGSRDFSAMPILADALQDTGCDGADILNHCRGDGPHVRGCWVVDLVLGKA